MKPIVFSLVFAMAASLAPSLCFSQNAGAAATASPPPVTNSGAVEKATLPPPPPGMVWNRIKEIDAAVLTPIGWKRFDGSLPNGKLFGFSDQALDAKRQFDRGLTVKLLWLPNSKGQESAAVDELLNQLSLALEGNPQHTQVLDARTGKKEDKILSVVRVRVAAPDDKPTIAHTIMIGDPVSGLVYQFLYLAPEATWEENWKFAEKMLNNIFISFPG